MPALPSARVTALLATVLAATGPQPTAAAVASQLGPQPQPASPIVATAVPAAVASDAADRPAAESPPPGDTVPPPTAPLPASGPPPSPPLASPLLPRLLDRTEERAPLLVELRARLMAAHHEIDPAYRLSPPMLETRVLDMGFPDWTVGKDPDSMVEVALRQELPARGVRLARSTRAAAELGMVSAELVAARAALRAEVAAFYANLFAIDREQITVDGSHELLDLLVATVNARYAAGEGDQAAVLATQVMTSMHYERLTDLTADRRRVLAELVRLGAITPGEPAGLVRFLPPPLPLPADWRVRVLDEAPAIGEARAARELARAETELARSELGTATSVMAGWGWRDGLSGALVVGLGIELPTDLRRRRRPMLEAAEVRLYAADLAIRRAEAEVTAEATRLAAEWDRLAAEIDLYDEAVLPQTSALFDAARTSYLTARGELMAVGNAFEQWLEVRLRRHHLAAERFATRMRIAALLAGDPGFSAIAPEEPVPVPPPVPEPGSETSPTHPMPSMRHPEIAP